MAIPYINKFMKYLRGIRQYNEIAWFNLTTNKRDSRNYTYIHGGAR